MKRPSGLDDSKGSTESNNNISKLDKILEIVEETKNYIRKLKRKLVTFKSGLASLTSRVEDLESPRKTQKMRYSVSGRKYPHYIKNCEGT